MYKKLDIMNAFDSVNWSSILKILKVLDFPLVFINWIMVCLTTPRYSIKINGALEDYFAGRMGLRQGDPLSPLHV